MKIVILIIGLFLISIIGLLIYKKIAINYNLLATINHRTLHSSSIPKGGGVVFSILTVLPVLFAWWKWQLSAEFFWVLGVGGFIAALVGFIDDVKNIRARIKLVVQLFLSSWVVFWLHENLLLRYDLLPNYVLILLLLFFMVWIINAYNFLDGIDGLAASGAIFVSSTIAIVLFLNNGTVEIMSVFILLATAVSGFMLFNWPPASIFMGDSGSIFLGYTFGALMLFTVKSGDLSIWNWLVVFGYFFADTTVTQITRVLLVKKWWHAHRSHAYQNLARITGSHLKVTSGVTIYHLFWILPLTLWSALVPEFALVAVFLAVSPAMVVAHMYGPRFSSS